MAVALLVLTPFAQAEDLIQVRMETNQGTILIELESARAPRTVENFLAYVDNDFYSGTLFHRVIEGFMIQGGGFTESFMRKTTRSPVRNEADNGLSNRTYSIAMARTSEPHSATAQFFINTEDNTNLDHSAPTPRGWGYTVFGRVIEGFEVVTSISETPTGRGGPFSRDVPQEPILILSASRVLPIPSGTDDAAVPETEEKPPENSAVTN